MMKGPRNTLPPLLLALGLFLLLAAYQLHLPGLHYDEAKEAGLNAMQLLTGQPLTAFRAATLSIGPVRLPLMVQDYIGALNVLLAVPFLALGGINVVALRWLPLAIAALTLVSVWRAGVRLGGPAAGAAAALLLAVNPSFVFWSRQGIFVTNLTALLFTASLLTGLRWWRGRRPPDLALTAFLWGLGIYAKLLFVWAIGATVVVAAGAWLLKAIADAHAARGVTAPAGENAHRNRAFRRFVPLRTQPAKASIPEDYPNSHRSRKLKAGKHIASAPAEQAEKRRGNPQRQDPHSSIKTSTLALVCFLLPLIPLILFNLRTGGTVASIFGNLGRSYYGVDNTAYLANLTTRLGQVITLLKGDHLWYLGGIYRNTWAPWLAAGLVSAASIAWAIARAGGQRRPPAFLLPLVLLALMVAQSAFTVSDLFITHYALLLPLVPLTGGLAFDGVWQACGGAGGQRCRSVAVLALLAVLAWAGGDLWTTVRYHQALAASGGYGAHSDANARLAAYLDEKGYATPIALDWGIDAPVRFLTAGRVSPIEIFGYERLDAPDAGFADRVAGLLQDNNTVYVGHPPEKAVFRGRVEAMAELATGEGRLWLQEAWFSDRSGEVLFIIYRTIPGG